MKPRILSVEDDLTLQTITRIALKDYDVHFANQLSEAKEKLTQLSFDGIIMDVSLPDGDGLRFIGETRMNGKNRDMCILVVSAHQDIQTKIMAFTLGADDFLTKPFDPLELQIRLKVRLLKHKEALAEKRIKRIQNTVIDLNRQGFFLVQDDRETQVPLTTTEFKIISLLTQNLEHVFSREQILEKVWGVTHVSDRTVDSHIAHLRKKISDSAIEIETLKNLGFKALKRAA